MPHLDEHTIDLFVQNRSLLSDDVRSQAERHLGECPACRFVADSLRAFYEELRTAPGRPGSLSPHQESVLNSLLPMGPLIQLSAYAPMPNAAPAGAGGLVVLAAKSQRPKGSARFETISTLASKKDGVLARILRDTQTGRLKVYMHAGDPSQLEAMLLTFPRIPMTLVLDDKGQSDFDLPDNGRPDDANLAEAIARLPVGYGVVMTGELAATGEYMTTVTGLGGVFRVKCSYKEPYLTLEIADQSPQRVGTALLVHSTQRAPLLIELEHGRGDIQIPELPRAFTIRLYE